MKHFHEVRNLPVEEMKSVGAGGNNGSRWTTLVEV